jgi:hypothetical protein
MPDRSRRSHRVASRSAARVAGDRPELHRLNGRRLWLLGKQRGALDEWRRGLGAATRLGMRPELARIHAEMARALASSPQRVPNGVSMEEERAQARALFTEIGLPWDLRRLERGTPVGDR